MGQVGISLEGRRRKPESLARLKQAARKLFVERGYDATRPQDIAREAGLGHGTFYLHYPDKRACFLSFVEDARQDLDAHLRARLGAQGSSTVTRSCRSRERAVNLCDPEKARKSHRSRPAPAVRRRCRRAARRSTSGSPTGRR